MANTRPQDLIRIGQVSSVSPLTGSCRVAFDDMTDGSGQHVAYDMQILRRRTVDCKEYDMPEVGEHVLCVFLPNGYQEGFVVGSYYTANNLPYYRDPDNLYGKQHLYRTQYRDGTIVEYDLDDNQMRIYSENHIRIECKNDYNDPAHTVEIAIDAKEAALSLRTHTPGGSETCHLQLDGKTGNLALQTNGDVSIVSGQNLQINTSGTTDIISGGALTITAPRIDIN